MRHLPQLARWALLLSALALPTTALAVDWTPKSTLTPTGTVSTWTATAAGEDSGVLTCQGTCVCDNTHASANFTVYRATKAGVKQTGDWWKGVAVTNCSNTTLEHCQTVELVAGSYIFDCDSAAACTAECRARLEP